MATVRDFLERLRPSGTPGAPSMSGVPADRVVERAAELEPLFARLAEVQAEANRIRADALTQAQARRAASVDAARSIVAEARRRAEAERGAAAAHAHAQARARAQEIVTSAQRQAEGIAASAVERLPALVETVLEQARADIAVVLAEHT